MEKLINDEKEYFERTYGFLPGTVDSILDVDLLDFTELIICLVHSRSWRKIKSNRKEAAA